MLIEVDGAKLKEIRLARKLTQKDVAERAGTWCGTVSRIERRGRTYLYLATRLCEALGVPLQDVVVWSKEPITEEAIETSISDADHKAAARKCRHLNSEAKNTPSVVDSQMPNRSDFASKFSVGDKVSVKVSFGRVTTVKKDGYIIAKYPRFALVQLENHKESFMYTDMVRKGRRVG